MGPLAGIKIIEFAGIGPCPIPAMMLAERGATVRRLDRVAGCDLSISLASKFELLKRSRHISRLNLKRPDAVALTPRLIERPDALIEGFPPKVVERLGLGPDVCLCPQPPTGVWPGRRMGAGAAAGAIRHDSVATAATRGEMPG